MLNYIFFIFDSSKLTEALSILNSINAYDEVIFVVTFKSISDFILKLNIKNSKTVLLDKRLDSIFNIQKAWSHNKYLRKIFNEEFSALQDWKVVFFDLGFELTALSIIKKLSRKNSIYYYAGFPYDKNFKKPKATLKMYFLVGLYKFYYDLDIEMYEIMAKYSVPVLKEDSFFKKTLDFIQKGKKIDNAAVLNKYAVIDKRLKRAKILFLPFDFSLSGYASKEKNDLVIKNIIGLLDKYYAPDEIAIKRHPVQFHGAVFQELEKYIILDRSAPAEFYFYAASFNYVIGISLVINNAARYSHIKAIAMHRLMDFYEPAHRDRCEKNLILSEGDENNKIIVPDSWGELEKHLANRE